MTAHKASIRVARSQRMIAELGHTDILDALAHAEEMRLRQALAEPPVAYRNKVDVKTGFMWNYTEAKLQDKNGNDLVEYQELYL